MFACYIAYKVHDLETRSGIQPAGRFIEEEDLGVCQK